MYVYIKGSFPLHNLVYKEICHLSEIQFNVLLEFSRMLIQALIYMGIIHFT